MTKKEVNKAPWFVIWTGVAIPILVSFIMAILYNGKFNSLFFLGLFCNIGLEIIPYFVLFLIWKRIIIGYTTNEKYGMIGAFVSLILSQSFWEIIHGIAYYAPHPDTSFTISLFFLSSGTVGSIGYGIGYLIGILVGKFRREM